MEVVTKDMILQWFEDAPEGSSHLLIATDEFDWSTYPVYVRAGEDIRKRHREEDRKPLQRVMEIYRLDYSFDKQVHRHRCFVYELPLDGYSDHVLRALEGVDEKNLERAWLSPLELAAVCSAELARRRAVLEQRAESAAMDRHYKRITRETEADGEAAGPSPIDATLARQDVDPPSVPPAPTASPSNSE